jgi:phosphatidylserine decarboxylase
MKKKAVTIFLFKVMPKSLLSRLFGCLTRAPLPSRCMNGLINLYCKKFNISMEDYESPAGGFKNFDMFFTRRLARGARKIDSGKDSIISPVDARVDQFGKIKKDSIIQAKGISYSLKDLIPSNSALPFENGTFAVLYLSPADYHRIHAPVSGKLSGYFHIPGKLYTVQEFMVQGLPGLFSINERLISYIETPKGRIAVCKVGAMNVGRITLSYADIATNKFIRQKQETLFDKDKKIKVKAGDEIGVFHLGSTVILLFEKGMARLDGIKTGGKVRLGQRIGRLL